MLPSAPLPESFPSCERSTTFFAQWTSWESNPEALIASQSADPSASPIHRVDWEVLESSSTVLQTAAKPSQLPVHASRGSLAPIFLLPQQQKRPGVPRGREHRASQRESLSDWPLWPTLCYLPIRRRFQTTMDRIPQTVQRLDSLRP